MKAMKQKRKDPIIIDVLISLICLPAVFLLFAFIDFFLIPTMLVWLVIFVVMSIIVWVVWVVNDNLSFKLFVVLTLFFMTTIVFRMSYLESLFLSHFDQIKVGMSYAEVEEIMGIYTIRVRSPGAVIDRGDPYVVDSELFEYEFVSYQVHDLFDEYDSASGVVQFDDQGKVEETRFYWY